MHQRDGAVSFGLLTAGEAVVQNTSYLQTQTIVKALEFTLNKGGFGKNTREKQTAAGLIRDMRSTSSVSGRHQQLERMLRKGASIEQMMKATRSSRRTIFRYLNHFEEAGLSLVLSQGRYQLS